jgi:hypothetical protein
MRHALALTATVLALAWAAPASAQMCGGSPSTTGATASAQAGGGMCGMMGRSAQASDPMATPSPQQGQRAAGGCPCCRMMAMMQGGQGGGMGGMMGGGMGGDADALSASDPADHARRSRDATDPAPAMTTLSRRGFVAALAAAPAIGAASLPNLTVTKDPTCSCCAGWTEHVRAAGFPVEVVETNEH